MRSILIYLLLLCVGYLHVLAQNLSEEEVTKLMTDAFIQNQAGKHQEALDGFLKVGLNTKKQRTEDERKVYVCSQTMAVMCYESLGKYEEGFRLSEELLNGNISDEEKKDLQHLYVINGYFVATSYIHKSNRRYAEARELFEKILPLADDDMRQRILPKIPLAWYFEGTLFQLEQKYGEALVCMEKARDGFHKIDETKNEIEACCQI